MILPRESSVKPAAMSPESLVRGLSEMSDNSYWTMEPSAAIASPVYNSSWTTDAGCASWHAPQPAFEPAYFFDPLFNQWSNPCVLDANICGMSNAGLMPCDSIYATVDQTPPSPEGTVDKNADLPCAVLLSGTGSHIDHNGLTFNEQIRSENSEDGLLTHFMHGPNTNVDNSLQGVNVRHRYAEELQAPQDGTSFLEHQLPPRSTCPPNDDRLTSQQSSFQFFQPHHHSSFNNSNYPASARSTTQPDFSSLPFLSSGDDLETCLARNLAAYEDLGLSTHLAEDFADNIPPLVQERKVFQRPILLPRSSDHSAARDGYSVQEVPDEADQRSLKRRDLSRDAEQDKLLRQLREQGTSYREIKKRLKFEGAESTLRGRYRALTKSKAERPRKPEWTNEAMEILKEAVSHFTHIASGHNKTLYGRARLQPKRKDPLSDIPWKQVAEYMVKHGCHRYGNATVKKKYCEIMGLKFSNKT